MTPRSPPSSCGGSSSPCSRACALGEPYVGFLYVSLMLTPDGPKVIEFNVRFGDPEAQVVLPLLDGPFAAALLAAGDAAGCGRTAHAGSRSASLASCSPRAGIRPRPKTGQPIEGSSRRPPRPDVLVFHAGTALTDGPVVTAGGRVLTVVGRGATYPSAMRTAYRGGGRDSFEGMQCRRDIGRKAVLWRSNLH